MNYRVETVLPGDHVDRINSWLISEPVHAFMPLGAWIERECNDAPPYVTFKTRSICRFDNETDAFLFVITFGGCLH